MTLYKGAVLNLEGQDSGSQRKFRVVLLSDPDTTFNEKTFREVQLVLLEVIPTIDAPA